MLDLDAIEARANAATPGPWDAIGLSGDMVYGHGDTWVATLSAGREADRDLMVSARADIPALVAEVRRLREALVFYASAAGMDAGERAIVALQ